MAATSLSSLAITVMYAVATVTGIMTISHHSDLKEDSRRQDRAH